MGVLYNFFIEVFYLTLKLASPFSSKASQWINGRKNLWLNLENAVDKNKKVIWFHCASLGEFEQARPVIERIKSRHLDDIFILLTFFSPSGYEIQKNFSLADYVTYIPIDRQSYARRFLSITKPHLIVFVKYEFWFNHLEEISKQNIKCLLISGIFWSTQQFFKPYGRWFANRLEVFNHFFVQNEESGKLLEKVNYKNVTVSGDSRFDRVFELANKEFSSSRIDSFLSPEKLTIVFGSSWEKENEFAVKLIKELKNIKLIIAPHEIKKEKVGKLHKQFDKSSLWSETKENQNLSGTDILIIDQIGMLSMIYRFGHLAVIGGGFGSGIHNTLEAAVYGCPVIFGPNYNRFQEANDLIDLGGAFSVNNYSELLSLTQSFIKEPEKLSSASVSAKNYVSNNAGATDKILTYINQENLLA